MLKKFLYFCLALAAASCSSPPPPAFQQEAGPEAALPESQISERRTSERRLVRTEPEQTPPWKDNPPRSQEEIFFVGLSRSYGSGAEARNDARENAFTQVMRFYGEFIQSGATERSSVSGSTADTIAALVNREEELMNFAQAVVSQVGTDGYFTEVYLDEQNREAYVVYALCRIPRQKAEQDIADFAKNTSERYGGLLAVPASLQAALLAYRETLAALEQNPLHRTVAYYDSPAGRVNLYEYLGLQLNTLTVDFGSLPAAVVQRGMPFTRTISLSSVQFSEIGPIPCRVDITGNNNSAPAAEYLPEKNNSFTLQILTPRLEAGNYTVQLELLLHTLVPALRQNPKAAFTLEVRPAAAVVNFAGNSLNQEDQRTLSQALQQALQEYHTPLKSGYEFLITLTEQERTDPALNMAVLTGEVSVALTYNGSVVLQSAPRRITETSRDRMIHLAGDYIRSNGDFWTTAGNKID